MRTDRKPWLAKGTPVAVERTADGSAGCPAQAVRPEREVESNDAAPAEEKEKGGDQEGGKGKRTMDGTACSNVEGESEGWRRGCTEKASQETWSGGV